MKRDALLVRYGLVIVVWCGLLYMNYRTAQHSVLPIRDTLPLPHFVVPASLILISASFLISGLAARSREAELADPTATVSIATPVIVVGARWIFGLAILASGFYATIGRQRPDLLYSTYGWGYLWIALGGWTLLSLARSPRLRVVVSPAGIRHPQLRPQDVSWGDVAEVKLKRVLLSRYVFVMFRDGADFHLSTPLWRWRKIKQLVFSGFFLGVDPETMATALKTRRDLHAF